MSGFAFFTPMSTNSFELGSWIGRRQAFSALAGQSMAAQAYCLRQIREKKLYLSVTGNWPDFCVRRAGLSRAQADRIIQYLDEFGDTYFHLNELIGISPDTYRAIQSCITESGLTYKGKTIPIDFEAIPELAAAVEAMRPAKPAPPPSDPFRSLVSQLRSCCIRLEALPALNASRKAELLSLAERLRQLAL